MCLIILLLVFGIVALVKGEFKITGSRKVKGDIGRILGVVMLIGAGVPFVAGEYGGVIQIVLLIVVIIIGLATSEKIEKPTDTE
jgi:hypothetical protein